MSAYAAGIANGLMDDGEHLYVPGVNCFVCGRFVGRDGYIGIDYFEMSNSIASVEGQCRRCLAADRRAEREEGS